VSAGARTPRDERRRRLGQNFLEPALADTLVAEAAVRPGELALEIGAGRGAITLALASRGAEVAAIELDPTWAQVLRARLRGAGFEQVRVIEGDALRIALPTRPFRVFGSLPFGSTTAIMRRLFDDPTLPLVRADLIVQLEVARKRAQRPPGTLLSTAWSPWWTFRLARTIPATAFRPVPRVDAGLLVATRHAPPLLPERLAPAWAGFVATHWPF
jgi:23S rRNA (adenine-N6)-dimethyltransferase